ncbi:phosphoserine phosphatase SerB [Mucisphaera calidilacus]|uniref:Phosphoserine phosphatase n=1 Tax=Mucisphaera calidilacus TaxID=2527982 RepID=A0A518BTC5_9BACT|nr:phosphoserine phosphatase SerB [Mucisphaera calidilacus]QDU70224.1 Phosphoserine phosphatase [Mucisphaera calidilacus]
MLYILHITGPDGPGITRRVMSALGGVPILDLNQSVIHQSVLLAMVVRVPDRGVIESVWSACDELGMTLTTSVLSESDYEAWRVAEGRPRYILTLIARTLTAERVRVVAEALADRGLNIEVITRLSGRPAIDNGRAAADSNGVASVEMAVRGELADAQDLKSAFLEISREHGIDVAWQVDDAFRRVRRLVAFDMDSTLIQHEVIDELAIEAGVGDRVAAVTESAMRGELDFEASLRQRVALLAGLSEEALWAVGERLNLTEGAETLVRNLKYLGYKTAILSGGFTYFGHMLQERLGIDYVAANQLEIIGGKLTGKVVGSVVDAQRKAERLEEIAGEEGIRLEQTIAVGDGANDLPMLSRAGLGIAFHAKPVVQASADQKITELGLDAILYLIGMKDSERVEDAGD